MIRLALLPLLLLLLSVSCSGLKVEKNPQPQQTSKPGVTWGGSPVSGGLTVQKVGYWCDVKGTILTFGSFGETEAKATEAARANCHKVYANHACPVVACKKSQ